MKVIITGATGFIGRNLAETLHADDVEVLATGRSPDKGEQLRKQGIEFRPADLLDLTRLTGLFTPADCVIHCAARAGDWGSYRDFYQANVIGTQNVIRACKHHQIKKILFISTPSIYYNGRDRYNISESDPLPARQTTHYSKTKLAAEKELLALQLQGFRVIVFRPRAVYGPYDQIIVPRILKMAEKKNLPLINDGQALVDITWVGNFVDAVRRSLVAPDTAYNQVYNISNGDPIRLKDWFAQILEIFGRPFKPKNVPEPMAKTVALAMELASRLPFGPKKPSLTRFSVGYMAKSMTLSIERAKKHLGYHPEIGNQESFEKYARWYSEAAK
jgi:nucleoside-diphosphate-sugar epimerase